ncbi:hypothetical protein BHE74_00049718 [Ensete ventricosum]|nr:hypothetical protein BHE74_00049718 [Ensete ventricosum]
MVKLAWLFSFRSSFLRRGARAFIVKGYEASVPEVLTVPIAYHAVVLRRTLRGPCDETSVVLPATGERQPCSSYPFQVDRTTVGPPMLVSSRLQSRRQANCPGARGHGSQGFGRESDLRHKSWDSTERVTSSTDPGDLAERAISGTNLGDLAERVISGTNPEDLVEGVISSINLGDLAKRGISGTNPGDLAERVISGTNPGIRPRG